MYGLAFIPEVRTVKIECWSSSGEDPQPSVSPLYRSTAYCFQEIDAKGVNAPYYSRCIRTFIVVVQGIGDTRNVVSYALYTAFVAYGV